MKLPNFRLYDTQARFSLLISAGGVVTLVCLSYLVFHGLSTDQQQWVIPYNPEGRMGRHRPSLIMLFTAITLLMGATAGIMGFRSLGQPRNTKQGFSWMGMLTGAMVLCIAPVLFYAWRTLNEPMILKKATEL